METNNQNFDVVIIGGGLAGLCSAIHLSKSDLKILVIEKNSYPKHKVCGEYISNEVLPYLEFLDFDVFKLGAKRINNFQLSTRHNKIVSSKLPLGGFGISRFRLDYELSKKVKACGIEILETSVEDVDFKDNTFITTTKNNKAFTSDFVLGAFGKRSNLDVQLERQFIKRKSPYLAVKIHVKGDFPEDVVALHNFEGGYCGVSKVENDHINLCYITNYNSFQKAKNIEDFQKTIIFKNNYLRSIFETSEPVFKNPLTISQISFEDKRPIESHIIMIGDTAALIHPLCGNGMSMAIRSAQIASRLIIKYYNSEISDRDALEKQYLGEWNAAFRSRLKTGRRIAKLFNSPVISELLMNMIKWCPWILPKIIKRTHGEVMTIE